MSTDRYKRGGSPFDKAIHAGVVDKMSETFKSELVQEMKQVPPVRAQANRYKAVRLCHGLQTWRRNWPLVKTVRRQAASAWKSLYGLSVTLAAQ